MTRILLPAGCTPAAEAHFQHREGFHATWLTGVSVGEHLPRERCECRLVGEESALPFMVVAAVL